MGESERHLEFEAVHDVLDVGARQRLSEAQLFGKVDLVVELVKLLQKLLLGHRTVQDGAARDRDTGHGTRDTGHGTRYTNTGLSRHIQPHATHSRDHGPGHHQLVHQLAEVAAHRLPVLQTHVHADRLLLQRLDLTADGRQVALEAAQHALHTLRGPVDRQSQIVETSNLSWCEQSCAGLTLHQKKLTGRETAVH